MGTTILSAVLTPLLFTQIAIASVSPANTPKPTITSTRVFTQVLPESNVVGYSAHGGETLGEIAKSFYGDENYWTTVWNDNPWITNVDDVDKGMLVKIRANKPAQPEELTDDLKKRSGQKDDTTPQDQTTPQTVSDSIQAMQADQTLTVAPTTVSVSIAPTDLPVAAVSYPASNWDDVYKAAGTKYGVPWQILYGIHMTETGGRNGPISSGHGPQGPMQFMPGTFRAYAVEGKNDINNADDAIYAAANFMAKHGSIEAGLHSYGGNNVGVLQLARARGFSN